MSVLRRSTIVPLAMLVGTSMVLSAVVAPASAVDTPASTRTAAWLAAQVGPDGSVAVPGDTASTVTQTMYVAQGLATTTEQRAALARAMDYISRHVEAWVVNDGGGSSVAPVGTDLPARLASLILLVTTVGGDPRAFGVPAQDLVARSQALYGVVAPGFYGWPDTYSAVQDQSLMVGALTVVGAPPPAPAVQWIVDQQCPATGPAASVGGWMALRTTTGGVLDPCTAPDPILYSGADTNSTAAAVQALVIAGVTAPIAPAVAFLHAAQATSGSSTAGFPWFAGGDADANSTALVMQAVLAAGQDPSGPSWSVGGRTPFDALVGWQLGAPDDGALEASWSPGVPSLLSTYQGMWGLTRTAFPFPVLPPWPPATPDVTPRFTG